ncbi:MAG: FHA domain-containing protein, partial [Planctomycetota bacterium]
MPKLIVKSGADVAKELPLDKEKFTIGRMPDNDLELRDSLVSRRHTELIRHGPRITLYDMGSSNGTFVNN